MTNNTNFDASKTMGELNYLIEEISEFWEQRNYISQELNKKNFDLFEVLYISLLALGIMLLFVSLILIVPKPLIGILSLAAGIGLILYGRKLSKKSKSKEERKEIGNLFKSKEKELDNFIKQEWNPRVKMLNDNSINYFSDKELRDKYNGFIQADREVQKLTRSGQRMQEFAKTLKVAGIATVAVTGAVLGGMSVVNKINAK